jgi:hypothetical protein
LSLAEKGKQKLLAASSFCSNLKKVGGEEDGLLRVQAFYLSPG